MSRFIWYPMLIHLSISAKFSHREEGSAYMVNAESHILNPVPYSRALTHSTRRWQMSSRRSSISASVSTSYGRATGRPRHDSRVSLGYTSKFRTCIGPNSETRELTSVVMGMLDPSGVKDSARRFAASQGHASPMMSNSSSATGCNRRRRPGL